MPDEGQRTIAERGETRTNVFVVALLRSASGNVPVRLRNISPRGMLVEGGQLPPAGTAVQVERGRCRAAGSIVWSDGGRAGLELNQRLQVQSWLPQSSKAGQARVDDIVHGFRTGTLSEDAEAPPGSPVADLCDIANDLEELAGALADNPQLLGSCGEEIQALSMLAQRLRQVVREGPIRT